MAAWLRHAIESAGWDRVAAEHSNRNDGYYAHLAQRYNDWYGDTATGDSFNINQPVISSLTASKICDGCRSDVPDVAVRWRCELCNVDCCLACGSLQQGDGLGSSVEYDLPPAAGESHAESERRRQRHRKREEAAIRDLHKWCVGGLPS